MKSGRQFVRTLIVALLFGAVTMALMASGGGEKAATAGTQAAAYNGKLPIVPEKVTLRYATHQGSASAMAPPSNDLPVYQYLEKITNVHIEWETVPWDSYKEVMTTRIAAGSDLPDIINLTGQTSYEKLDKDGIIIPQNDLIEKYGFTIKQFFQQNPSYKALMTAPNGNVYCVENTVLDSHLSIMPMINKYALERVGLPMPQTTTEFYNVLKAFRDKDINGNGKADEVPFATIFKANEDSREDSYIYQLGNAFGLEMTWDFGRLFRVRNGKLECQYQLPEFKEFLASVNRLYKEGLINKDLTTANLDKLYEYATTGQAGAISFWSTYAYCFGGLSPDNHGDKDGTKVPVFVPAPAFTSAPGVGGYYSKRQSLNGDGMGISTKCAADKRAVAMMWIDFLFNGPEARMTQSYGVEGVSYTKKADGTIEKITPAGKEWSAFVTEIGGNQPPRAHQQTLDGWRAWMPKWLEDVDTSFQKYYKELSMVNMQWTAAEQEEMDKTRIDLQTYIDESVTKFILGQQSLDTFTTFVQELDKRGLPAIKKLYEQRYERQKKILGK